MKINEIINEHIGKVKDGYRLYSHAGKNLGTFPTKAGAEKHEREVQYFKHANENEMFDEGEVVTGNFGKSGKYYKNPDIKIPTRKSGEPYDHFEAQGNKIIGVTKDGKKILVAATPVASEIVDIYNRGGFSDKEVTVHKPSDVFKEQEVEEDSFDGVGQSTKQITS